MRRPSILLFAVSTALVMTLSGCGGGSSSASGGGGGSGGTIAGTVDNGLTANRAIDSRQQALLALTDVVIRTAHASGVSGVTVELLDGTGMVVQTTTTNTDGNFIFTGLLPGRYTMRLSQDGSVLGETPSVQVDSNTRTNIKLSLDGTTTSVEVEAENNVISGEVETEGADDNGASHDDGNDDNGSDAVDDDAGDDHGNRSGGSDDTSGSEGHGEGQDD